MTIELYYKNLGTIPSPAGGATEYLCVFVIIFSEETSALYDKLVAKFTSILSECSFPYSQGFSYLLMGTFKTTNILPNQFVKYDVASLGISDHVIDSSKTGFMIFSQGSLHDIYSVCASVDVRGVVPNFVSPVDSAQNRLSSTQINFSSAIEVLAAKFPDASFSLAVFFDNPMFTAAVKVYARSGFANPVLAHSLNIPLPQLKPSFVKLSTSSLSYVANKARADQTVYKAERIKKDFEKDPCKTERGVIVVNFIENDTQKLVYSGNYCGDTEKIHYNCIYLEVSMSDYTQKAQVFRQIFMQTVPECSIGIMYVNGLTGVGMFTDFIRPFTFLRNVVAYINYVTPIPPSIPGLRILNIKQTPAKDVQLSTEYIGGYEFINVAPELMIPNPQLECQWWFEREITKSFGCGNFRLIQRTGTCFLNAVVNCIILSEKPREMFLANLKRVLAIDPTYEKVLKTDIDALACPLRFDPKQSIDMLNIFLYNFFMGKKIKTPSDVFKITSRKFLSRHRDPTKVLYGQGGWWVFSLLSLLGDTLLSGFSKRPGTEYIEITHPVPEHVVPYFLSLPSIPPADLAVRSAAFDYFIDFESTISMEPHINIGGTVYDLDFSIIVLTYIYPPGTPPDKRIDGHVIAGFICNGMQLVYDSYTNKIFKANWQNTADPITVANIKRNVDMGIPYHINLSSGFYSNSLKIYK